MAKFRIYKDYARLNLNLYLEVFDDVYADAKNKNRSMSDIINHVLMAAGYGTMNIANGGKWAVDPAVIPDDRPSMVDLNVLPYYRLPPRGR